MLKRNYIAILLIFLMSFTYAQKKEAYKSQRKWTSKRKVSEKDLRYGQYLSSAIAFRTKDLEKSIDYISKSIEVLGREARGEKLALSLTELSKTYQYHKQYNLALENIKNALKENYTIDRELLLGQILLLNHDINKARSVFLSVLQLKNSTPAQQVEAYEGLGDSYRTLGFDEKAKEYYTKGVSLAIKTKPSKLSSLNTKIGDVLAEQNQLQQAEEFYDNSLKISAKETPKKAVIVKEKVADYYNKNNQFDEEIKLRKETVKKLEEVKLAPLKRANTTSDIEKWLSETEDSEPLKNQKITTQSTKLKIATAYKAKNEYDDAIDYLKNSIEDAKADNDLIVQKDALKALAELYKEQKDYKKSLVTYESYTKVAESLYAKKEQEAEEIITSNQVIVARQSKINTLEKDRELYSSRTNLAKTEEQLIRESNKRQRLIIYSLTLGLLLMGLVTYFFYKSNKQKEFTNNLLALKSLRSQMNPHFIFNALNSVNNFIAKSDERSANRFLSDFSTLMRSVLENSEEDFIPLSKELKLLKLYTELEHSRFPDKFDYKIDIDPHIDVDSFQIPPMLLQPYIENAIWHGLRYKEGKGFLHIDLKALDNNTITIKIEDNGIGRKKSQAIKTQHQKKQRSKGMGNIKKRIAVLNQMYKDKVDVTITDVNTDGTGTCVMLKLKKEA